MKYLILNAGSSSIKFKLFKKKQREFSQLKEGGIDRIGENVPDHKQALTRVLEDNNLDLREIDLVGHRIVHGGDEFVLPIELTATNLKKLKKYNKLAPLHNPHQLNLVRAINLIDENLSQYAVFDTAFFANLPEKTTIYPLPLSYYQEDKIKRYGFHGSSHKYLVFSGAKEAGLKPTQINTISIHLGAGSSITATKNGSPIDTSLGFTPLEGLMMQTRPGDIDPGIITYLEKERNLTSNQIEDILNNQSGLLAIAGRSDMRDILFLAGEKIEDDNYQPKGFEKCGQEEVDRAKLALEMFIYRVQKYIGAYTAVLGRTDLIVFGGAIGSGSSVIREKITRDLSFMLKGTKITSLETNEELQIARDIDLELSK